MDQLRIALALMVPLVVALGCAISFLVGDTRRARRRRAARRSRHRFRGQGEAITVAELVDDATEKGQGIRLSWPEDDLYRSPIRPDELGQFPTVILPRVDDVDRL
ncbi:MAG TPA: hypothetical protein VFV67_16380 [Actinophytocola sp.]|uniref:hypothetical protein n=1 Tax=Actinophytocola sp. TaxID=1872138 RepID=UPI002DB8A6B7|nr:hypothetical protein [Actinophytocola sp.]HEU5472232.1 hypothetical protein [Actinophytocola sp.]